MIKLCPYRIERDHDNSTKCFVVNVPEAGHLGLGCQVNIKGKIYGLSVYKVSHNKGGWQQDSTNKFGLRRDFD